MKDKTTRFLIISLAGVSILCILVFSFLAVRTNRKGAEAVGELGAMYMAGMSEQAATHFGTAIELRLSQVGALVDSVPPSSAMDRSAIQVALNYNARARGFDHLALCAEDGTFEMLYGSQVQADNLDSFLDTLRGGEETMGMGQDHTGEKLILMGIPAAYPMAAGGSSVALVAALPMSYISDTLSLDVDNAMIYYFIIDRDGNFIIRDSDVSDESYFQRVRDRYNSVEGMTGEQYIVELEAAMAAGKNYTSEFTIDGERRHLYGTSLPYSDWYLLLFMPYGPLNRTVNALGRTWNWSAVFSCGLILAALLVVFFHYFRLARRQVHDLEEARLAAEHANRAKSEFLSNMSHDIRTPMNGIMGMTSIAIANLDNIQQVQNCLRKIALSSRHLLGLVNDILDMSKIESGKLTLHPEQLSLQETMQGIVNIIQPQINAKNQRFDVYIYDIPNELVYCDSVRLNQILLNLLGNAIKFTPEGGKIDVALYEEDSPRGDAWVRVHLRVKDTGIGMTPEFKEKIFESFTREDSQRVQKTEGSGLGMAITKYIVDAMQGTIEVESEPGRGSEFHVTLDLEKVLPHQETMELPDWELLLVDDDELLCESAVATLKTLGCRAEWVMDGEAAVRRVRERHERGENYRFILLDLKLPGMNGIETARAIHEICGDESSMLLVTAADWIDLEEEARSAGITGSISKPLFRSNLYYGLKNYGNLEPPLPAEQKEEGTILAGRRILLAEDNDLNWEIAEELLSEQGLILERAENGKRCVDLFEGSELGWYDAILMDIRMPVMTGYEATVAIRALERPDAQTIPIIAMSADAFSEDVKRCLDCGMNGHAAKPIDVAEVSRLLEKHINATLKKPL